MSSSSSSSSLHIERINFLSLSLRLNHLQIFFNSMFLYFISLLYLISIIHALMYIIFELSISIGRVAGDLNYSYLFIDLASPSKIMVCSSSTLNSSTPSSSSSSFVFSELHDCDDSSLSYSSPQPTLELQWGIFIFGMTMKCFPFYTWDTTDGPKTKSVQSSALASTSTDKEASMLGDEINSQNTTNSAERKFSDPFNSPNVSNISSGTPGRLSFSCLSQGSKILRVFSYEELKLATKSFSRSFMIGEGGFGPVHKGSILDTDDSNKRIEVAVKQLSQRGLQGHKEWVTEVNLLGVAEHPNLVKLIGYCFEDNERGIERLLVYEYMPNRSVQDHLSARFSLNPIPWIIRLRIAQDAARGLAYLHEGMDFQIIFRDFKSSNILLDEQWRAKLSDFGLARLGPANGAGHVSTAVVGTIGYAAPEYIQTGHLTSKSDVWSYGVFLYELITGRRPLDRSKPKQEQNMLDWVRSHLSDMKKFEQILDPRLEGRYSLRSAQRLAAIANKCLARQAKKRPTMTEVLEMVNRVLLEEETETTNSTPETPLEDIITVSEGTREVNRGGVLKFMFCGSSYTSRKQIVGVANLDY